jgi:hypothetical protein
VAGLISIILLLRIDLLAEPARNKVICRDELAQTHRDELANQLQKITGWSDLKFDRGILLPGTREPIGGSNAARELLNRTVFGRSVVALEDASRSSDVVFSRVVPGKWKHAAASSPPAFVVQIDFADFEHVIGDARALQAFNAGWVLLHEFDHIVNDSKDAILKEEVGACEDHINQMRRECNLPLRADYFFTFLPIAKDSAFMNRLVRLAFDQELTEAGKKKRYWLIWDANLVGGMDQQKQIASLR